MSKTIANTPREYSLLTPKNLPGIRETPFKDTIKPLKGNTRTLGSSTRRSPVYYCFKICGKTKIFKVV